MNETVRKLVDIVFRDTEQTEEVQVLYEQVLLDCQERYSDLVKDGMDEDEAIAAVVESLKGMDEILKDYPVREQPEEQMESSGEQAPEKCALNLPADEVESIAVSVSHYDVHVLPASDEQIHLHADSELLRISRNGKTIQVEEVQKEQEHGLPWFLSILNRLSMDQIPLYIEIPGGISLDYQLRTAAGDILWEGVEAQHASMHSESGDVWVQGRPCRIGKMDASTVSGDIRLNEKVYIGDLVCHTVSGDLLGSAQYECLEARTVSGDIELEGNGETIRLDTLSGDINLDGSCTSVWCKSMSGDVEVDVDTAQLTLTSTSGDIMVSGKAKEISSKTVSGEIQMEMLDGSQLDLLHAESRSGDISIHLPQPGNYTVEMTSRSGDTRSKVPAPRSGEKTAQVFAKTMSGDIVVR